MAKPIPVNRRYLENHQGATPAPPTPTPTPAPPSANRRDALREVIAFLRGNPRHNDPDWDDEEPDLQKEMLAMWDEEDDRWDDEEPYYPEEADLYEPEELYEEYAEFDDAPVISARYAGTCPACGNPIRVGEHITRHARLDAWVHVGCRYSQSRAPFRSIAARYDGYCRLCRQPFPPGQAITNLQGYGWVHLECARQHQARD